MFAVRAGAPSTGATAYQPAGGFFRTTVSGTHRACLDTPDGAEFDLALVKWSGRSWTVVAEAARADRKPTHTGPAVCYRYRILACAGSGAYSLGYDSPECRPVPSGHLPSKGHPP